MIAEEEIAPKIKEYIDKSGYSERSAPSAEWCKSIGISVRSLREAYDYVEKDKVQRLKRQLISDLLDDKLPTEESYEAIVKLYRMMDSPKGEFIKQIGISHNTLTRALNYINDKTENPSQGTDNVTMDTFCKEIGIARITLTRAL